MLITPEYRDINRFMLATKNYGVSGHQWAKRAHEYAVAMGAESFLDYGAGQGTLVANLPPHEYAVAEYDPGIIGKDSLPEPAAFLTCTDVLEHIEPDCLDDVLNDIFRLASKAVYLIVATIPAQKHLPDGRNAHLIVKNSDWWLPKLLSRWQLIDFRDYSGHCFEYLGMPRRKPGEN